MSNPGQSESAEASSGGEDCLTQRLTEGKKKRVKKRVKQEGGRTQNIGTRTVVCGSLAISAVRGRDVFLGGEERRQDKERERAKKL